MLQLGCRAARAISPGKAHCGQDVIYTNVPCINHFRAGDIIRGGPQVGKVATYAVPPGGSPPLQSGRQNHKWPTSGQGGYITPATWGVPTTLEGGLNQKWPTSGQGGYITPAAWGVPTA